MSNDSLQQDLVLANHILANQRVVDSYRHVSVRDPQSSAHFFLSASVSPEQVALSDLLRFTLDGQPDRPSTAPLYSERVIHSAIYAARPDVQAVIHAHADEVLPFTVTDVPLRPVLHVAGIIGSSIPVWDIADTFGATDLLVTDQDQADDLARCLGQGRVVLMRGHGFTVAAESLELAVRTAIYLKVNAQVQLAALRLGAVRYLSDDEIAAVNARMGSPRATRRVWDNWARQVAAARTTALAAPSAATRPALAPAEAQETR